ncbi:MAG: sensor histidine kinase [Pseudonocardia sp.]|uniref:sensor histidine kinase n=1 Tax=unclassified Pseudonocardia TaxID=2619320 RepID=UPI000A4E54D9|nr:MULTISPECIES: histidine kinase [unclassified Pseudonocardia]MBN9110605.1 sensor histidine kinase [Pseudonocardia sp.]
MAGDRSRWPSLRRYVGGTDIADPTRLTLRKWLLMAGGWSLLLLPWVYAAAVSEHPPVVRVLLTLNVLAYVAAYCGALYYAMWAERRLVSLGTVALMAGLWVGMVVGLGAGGTDGGVLYTISFLIVTVIALLPRRVSGIVALAVVAGGILLYRWQFGPVDLGSLIGIVAMTFAMIGMFGLIRANSELRNAREELARMAVTEERDRMARDLHDVLGHSLTTITVKAGLARRLLERGDDARAADEVADVERLGRQALADVRATISANRVASLAAELAGAREALRAADIEADLPRAVDDVPADRRQVFAYVLREGVTNAIRHSGAGRVTVRLAPDSIEVADDGVGAPSGTPAGNGLTGLAERLAAIGGWIDSGPGERGGRRLVATCPPARTGSAPTRTDDRAPR